MNSCYCELVEDYETCPCKHCPFTPCSGDCEFCDRNLDNFLIINE